MSVNEMFLPVATSHEAIDELDRIRQEKGISQMEISHMAEILDNGMKYLRMYRKHDCKLSVFLKFLQAEGCELAIIRRDV